MKLDDTLWKSILEDIFEDFLLFLKVYCQNGGDEWIPVHIELQGYHDPEISGSAPGNS